MKSRLSVAVLAALLVNSSLVFAQTDVQDWDVDGDRRISLAEWDTGIEMANVFDNLDSNRNEVFDIGEARLPHFSFTTDMDVDAGGRVERAEFIFATFDRLDEDQDGYLEMSEIGEIRDYAETSDLFD